MLKGELKIGLDYCQNCGRVIMRTTINNGFDLWVDDDSGDSYCPAGFSNFHKPVHDHTEK